MQLRRKMKRIRLKPYRISKELYFEGIFFINKLHDFRLAEIRRNEESYEKKLAEYYAGEEKAEEEKSEQEKTLERRIREIQEYFGYWIDPKDPRFDVMLKQKEAEEKKVGKFTHLFAKKCCSSSYLQLFFYICDPFHKKFNFWCERAKNFLPLTRTKS